MDMHIGQSYFVDELGGAWTRQVLAPYREWLAALPEPLGTVSRDLIGEEIGNSNLVHFPWLVGEAFEISEPLVHELVAANAFMLTYFLASDRLFDAPRAAHRTTILLATLLHSELLRRYERVAPGRAAAIWHDVVADHARGLLAEERHHADVRRGEAGLSLPEYERVVAGKNRYGVAVIRLLAACTGRHAIAAVLERIYDHMAIEIEFDDDLKDWQEDLREGRYTPTVTMLIGGARSARLEDIRAAVVESSAIADILDRIDTHLGQAEMRLRVATFPHGRLSGWLARHREANRRLRAGVVRQQISAALARSLAR